MAKYKHLTLNDRITISVMLDRNASFKESARALDKDPSSISKEVRSHLAFRRVGAFHLNYNACAHRNSCTLSNICSPCVSQRKFKLCRRCSFCNKFCKDFRLQICDKLLKPPYVCNPCRQRDSCSLEKRFYYAAQAHKEYRLTLSEARSGISFSEPEIRHLDEIISPRIQKGQSPHHICSTCSDSLMVSERTIYRLIDQRVISAMNLDLPRKVRFASRKRSVSSKVDKACRNGRTYKDYISFRQQHPDLSPVQLDSVIGSAGGKALLTIHFTKAEFMLAFLRDHNDSASVISIFEQLFLILGQPLFSSLFALCLTDNGSEFSNPTALEYDSDGHNRMRIFYCDPSAPYQKGSAERNHEFIRLFLPKGSSLDHLSQDDVRLMMDHINSYARASLADKSPYEVFSFLYGQETLEKLECLCIPPQDVTLKPSIFSKEVRS